MHITWEVRTPPTPAWRLQTAALEDPAFQSSLESAVIGYFELNTGSTDSVLTEREAFKVVTRGHCLGNTWSIRKELDESLSTIERRLLRLETLAIARPEAQKQLDDTHAEREELLERLHCHNYLAHSACSHSAADKAGKLLAYLKWQEHPQRPIQLLVDELGHRKYTQWDIHTVMMKHYTRLYASKSSGDDQHIEAFLTAVELHTLTIDQFLTLDSRLTVDEVREALLSLASRKTLGKDKLPTEFFKTYAETLVPRLHSLYTSAITNSLI